MCSLFSPKDRIALIHYADGEKRYILLPKGLKVGDTIHSGPEADITPGNGCWVAPAIRKSFRCCLKDIQWKIPRCVLSRIRKRTSSLYPAYRQFQ